MLKLGGGLTLWEWQGGDYTSWQLSGRSPRNEPLSPHNEHSVHLEESGFFQSGYFFPLLSGDFQITGRKNPHPEALSGLPLPKSNLFDR